MKFDTDVRHMYSKCHCQLFLEIKVKVEGQNRVLIICYLLYSSAEISSSNLAVQQMYYGHEFPRNMLSDRIPDEGLAEV